MQQLFLQAVLAVPPLYQKIEIHAPHSITLIKVATRGFLVLQLDYPILLMVTKAPGSEIPFIIPCHHDASFQFQSMMIRCSSVPCEWEF
jgi:hypothetical protein